MTHGANIPPSTIVDAIPTSHANAKYPWHEWLDGQPRKVTQGVHFHGKANNFAQYVRTVVALRPEYSDSEIVAAQRGNDVYLQRVDRLKKPALTVVRDKAAGA